MMTMAVIFSHNFDRQNVIMATNAIMHCGLTSIRVDDAGGFVGEQELFNYIQYR